MGAFTDVGVDGRRHYFYEIKPKRSRSSSRLNAKHPRPGTPFASALFAGSTTHALTAAGPIGRARSGREPDGAVATDRSFCRLRQIDWGSMPTTTKAPHRPQNSR